MNDAVQLKQEKERGRERKINITKQKQTKKNDQSVFKKRI